MLDGLQKDQLRSGIDLLYHVHMLLCVRFLKCWNLMHALLLRWKGALVVQFAIADCPDPSNHYHPYYLLSDQMRRHRTAKHGERVE